MKLLSPSSLFKAHFKPGNKNEVKGTLPSPLMDSIESILGYLSEEESLSKFLLKWILWSVYNNPTYTKNVGIPGLIAPILTGNIFL